MVSSKLRRSSLLSMPHSNRSFSGPSTLKTSICIQHSVHVLMQGYKAPAGLTASDDMAAVIQHAELLLMVIPTPFVASTIKGIRDQLRPEQVLLHCCTHSQYHAFYIKLVTTVMYGTASPPATAYRCTTDAMVWLRVVEMQTRLESATSHLPICVSCDTRHSVLVLTKP